MRVFNEIQRFDQWWFRLVMLMILATMAISIWTVLQENLNTTETFIALILGLISLGVIVLISFYLKLETRINEQGVHYGFWPFQRQLKHIPWNDIKKIYVRQYNALTEYGGWGYRLTFSKHGKAYNVKGNKGIQIVFKDGKKTLIGTQKPEEARSIIQRYIQNKEL
ncbi:MAG: hypothetical protein R3359_12910 [Marinirhabdus sp.]|nr:hypothetical protein [Marinirhabdus sp.]